MWRKIQKLLGTVVPTLLLIVYLAVAVCLLNRWDAMVAVTLIPIWVWAGAGMLISLISWIACRGVAPGVMFCLCLVTAVGFSEETHGIVRELIASLKKSESPTASAPKVIRIVNVHCAGKESALRKAAESAPDVLVVQGAPDKMALEAVADQLYGVDRSVTNHGTLAILGRGETIAILTDPQGAALHVRLRHPDGLVLDITGLDLEGCAPNLDIWRPAIWKELITDRVENRRLVRTYLGENPISRENVGRIISGGFGTPPDDDVYRPLENSGMLDTYAKSGQGWGNTFPSTYPVLRLDQIWVSPNLKPLKSGTRLNPESASRIVVSEVQMPASITPSVPPS